MYVGFIPQKQKCCMPANVKYIRTHLPNTETVYRYHASYHDQAYYVALFYFCLKAITLAQFPDLSPDEPCHRIAADQQSVSCSVKSAAKILLASSYRHHGKILHVEQAWLDMVSPVYGAWERPTKCYFWNFTTIPSSS